MNPDVRQFNISKDEHGALRALFVKLWLYGEEKIIRPVEGMWLKMNSMLQLI